MGRLHPRLRTQGAIGLLERRKQLSRSFLFHHLDPHIGTRAGLGNGPFFAAVVKAASCCPELRMDSERLAASFLEARDRVASSPGRPLVWALSSSLRSGRRRTRNSGSYAQDLPFDATVVGSKIVPDEPQQIQVQLVFRYESTLRRAQEMTWCRKRQHMSIYLIQYVFCVEPRVHRFVRKSIRFSRSAFFVR